MLMVVFVNDTATTEIYTLSLHDALPIYLLQEARIRLWRALGTAEKIRAARPLYLQRVVLSAAIDLIRKRRTRREQRSEEHTSELQSRQYLVCRLLLEKTKND